MVLTVENRKAKPARAGIAPILQPESGQAPLGFAAGDTNLYRYVFNNPINLVDPSGLSGKGAHHPYPLMLGGADATQPLFELDESQHTAAEKVLEKYGVRNYNNKALNDAARARWAAFGAEKQRAIIIESLKAAGISESLINKHIDKIMEGAQAGKNCTTLTRASIKGRVISSDAIQEAAKLTKLATAFGGILIVGGVSYANDKYIEAGEKGGNKMATKAILMLELRRAWNSDELPNSSFIMKWRDGAVKVQYERTPQGRWITALKVTVDGNGKITDSDGYLIKPGDLPLDFKPGNPLTAP